MRDSGLSELRNRYLNLLVGCLCRDLFPEVETKFNPDIRNEGRDWPEHAETMIGRQRMTNLVESLTTVLDDDIPGDFIETGVWRGGATILMRAALFAWNDSDRQVWLADSFCGLPEPDSNRWPADKGFDLSGIESLAVSRTQVEAAFDRYGMLDNRVRFLEGWFGETLPQAPIKQLALLRLDGDLYQSTWEALDCLYPLLSTGGIVIVDDYGAFEPCRQAVDDYRRLHCVAEEMHAIDWTGIWWRRHK